MEFFFFASAADFTQRHVEVFARKVLPQACHLRGSTVAGAAACRKLVGNVPTRRYAPLWRTFVGNGGSD
jgi:hypothetical protein